MNIFITGASSGIGAAIARRLGRDHMIGALARRTDRLEALAHAHSKIIPLPGDVTQPDDVAAAVQAFEQRAGPIQVLINNAGLALGMGPAHEAEPSDWRRMIDVNCYGLASVTNAVLPGMVSRREGLILNLGSVAGTYPYPGGHIYGATKAFVRQFSRNLRADLHGTGVRVCNLEPGTVEGSEFSQVRFQGDQQKVEAIYMGWKPLTADDIAEQVAWLLTLPVHVNINAIESMSVDQSPAGFQFAKEP